MSATKKFCNSISYDHRYRGPIVGPMVSIAAAFIGALEI